VFQEGSVLAGVVFLSHLLVIALQHLETLLLELAASQILPLAVDQVFPVVRVGVQGELVLDHFIRDLVQVVVLLPVNQQTFNPPPSQPAQLSLYLLFAWYDPFFFLEELLHKSLSNAHDVAVHLVAEFPLVLGENSRLIFEVYAAEKPVL
jgi:hypothetical protein